MKIWFDRRRIVAERSTRWFGTILVLAVAFVWCWSSISPLRLPINKDLVATDSRHILLVLGADLAAPDSFATKVLDSARMRGTSIYLSFVLFGAVRLPFWILFVLPGIPTLLIWWSRLCGLRKASGVCGVRGALSMLAISIGIVFVISGCLELHIINLGVCSAHVSNGCLEFRSPAEVSTPTSSWITLDDNFCVGLFFLPGHSNSTGNSSKGLLRLPIFPCFLVAWTWLSWRFSMLFVPRSTLQCSRCAYNLTGNVSGVCSECGAPIRRSSSERYRTTLTGT